VPDVSRTVLITGASSGIGEATALRLVRAGWKVVATARRQEALAPLAAAGCATARLDVADIPALPAAVAAIAAAHGAIGVLINNAGYSQSGVLEMLPIALIRRQFEANVFGLLRLTQLVLPGMRAQRWGKVVNISSMGGRLTFPGGGAYHASKHALEALSDVLRFEVGGFGIDVIVIQPGLIATRFYETAVGSMEGYRPDPGPYAPLEEAVLGATASATTTRGLARLSGTADDVARVIHKAIAARRPRSRYKVSASAHVLLGLRRLLGDRGWDRFVRRAYPQPGGGSS
jgi:NAD(P)-dependent dehydrogenase (short-subunit alcohol dehydrogenase family)